MTFGAALAKQQLAWGRDSAFGVGWGFSTWLIGDSARVLKVAPSWQSIACPAREYGDTL